MPPTENTQPLQPKDYLARVKEKVVNTIAPTREKILQKLQEWKAPEQLEGEGNLDYLKRTVVRSKPTTATRESFLRRLFAKDTETYQAPTPTPEAPLASISAQPAPLEPDYSAFDHIPEGFSKAVPGELRGSMMEAAQHAGISPGNLRAQFGGESQESWDATTTGWMDPTDIGITQLNKHKAIPEITAPRGKNGSFWEQNYGKQYGKFDSTNPHHQILGAGIYMSYLRQFALPEQGITNPTTEAVSMAYNLGAANYAKVINGTATQKIKDRYNDYKDLLKRHGYQFEE